MVLAQASGVPNPNALIPETTKAVILDTIRLLALLK